MKFNRTYKMTIQVSEDELLVIQPPADNPEKMLTITFDITRGVLHGANHGNFQIYNLGPANRLKIYHDRYDTQTYRGIVLQAGYEGQIPLPIIFQGNIQNASSYRQGPNWITEIEALDGGFGIANGQVSQTVPKGWNLQQIIQYLLGTMPKVGIGAIGNFQQQNSRGLSLIGGSWDILGRLSSDQNSTAFIDNEQANFLNDDEYIEKPEGIDLIEASTGLLHTPRRYDARVDVQILFEPRLIVGQLVQLNSAVFDGLSLEYQLSPGLLKYLAVNNGQYKVQGVNHRGTISGAIGGEAITTANLYLGPQVLKAVPPTVNALAGSIA